MFLLQSKRKKAKNIFNATLNFLEYTLTLLTWLGRSEPRKDNDIYTGRKAELLEDQDKGRFTSTEVEIKVVKRLWVQISSHPENSMKIMSKH